MAEKLTPEQFVALLKGVEALGPGRWESDCPRDSSGSRGVLRHRLRTQFMENGKLWLNCSGGCHPEGILNALGLQPLDGGAAASTPRYRARQIGSLLTYALLALVVVVAMGMCVWALGSGEPCNPADEECLSDYAEWKQGVRPLR